MVITMLPSHSYSAQDILEHHKSDLFIDAVSLYNPLTSAGAFLRKAHKSNVFNRIHESINSLSNEEREKLMADILRFDPDEDTVAGWEKALENFRNVENENLQEVFNYAASYLKKMERGEQAEAIRDMLTKIRADVTGFRSTLSENVMEVEDVEPLLVIDETLTLLLSITNQCMYELKKSKTTHPNEYLALMFILIVRLEKFRRGKIDLDRMYWTNAAVSTEFFHNKKTMTTAPEELLSIMAR